MAIFTVTNTADSGAGSLREAVSLANADADADTIVFAAALAGQTITLTSGELSLTNDVTIDGDINGDDKADITLSGNDASRIIHVQSSGSDVTLASLTLTDGNAGTGNGGAILTELGTNLVLTDTTVKDSAARLGGGIYIDGAVGSASNLTTINVTITGNSASQHGGGVAADRTGTATFVNTTIHGNSATINGGGIDANVDRHIVVENSTITNNQAGYAGGGIHQVAFGIGTLTMHNSVMHGNTGFSAPDVRTAGTFTAGNNFFGSYVLFDIDVNQGGNLYTGGNPLLGALQDNGGSVATRSVLSGSILIAKGSSTWLPADTLDIDGDGDTTEALPLDARGAIRAVGTLDLGAYEVATPTTGNDKLIHGVGSQTLDGGDGADTIQGGADGDALTGGAGNDIIVGGAGGDTIDGGADNDRVSFRFSFGVSLFLDSPVDNTGDAAGDSYASIESFIGSFMNDLLVGRDAAGDSLSGIGGDDVINGLGGADTLSGGEGDDALGGGTGDDRLLGGDGSDGLQGEEGADTLLGGDGDDFMSGGSENDNLQGQDGNDYLSGDEGADTLTGGAGADTIDGGAGRDVMRGGAGADVFLFSAASHSPVGAQRDVIIDFEDGVDLIDITAMGSTIISGAFTGAGREVKITYGPTSTTISIDSDGDRIVDAQFLLRGITSGIDGADLVLGNLT